ncbi:hypothetical protein M9H77_36017 [Catharanthus roseus]|uniref:Uncharacterized protein n=1 Tax=Catharanthus roseus TaxID=4058 RepID=A0ACB9ZUW1_CATRO|nr:hypothetical protein M9H77_36017 [Catharanthus roseus]
MKTSFQSGFGENQVNGRVTGLHCTWLVLRTRASFDDVDGLLTLRVDPLEERRSTLRAWPNRYLLIWECGCFVIERSYGVWLVSTMRCQNLVPMASFWGSRLSALMCLDSLRLPSCTRNPHSRRSQAQQATEVVGQEFLDQISRRGICLSFLDSNRLLVLRGMQIPYSAAVDLVAGLGYHRWYQRI